MLSVVKRQRDPHKAFIQSHQHCESASHRPARGAGGRSGSEASRSGPRGLAWRSIVAYASEEASPARPAPGQRKAVSLCGLPICPSCSPSSTQT